MINEKFVFKTLGVEKTGNLTRVESVAFDVILKLIKSLDLKLDERQNNSPSTEEFIEWVNENEAYDDISFEIYVVDNSREDSRITIEAIVLGDESSNAVAEAFINSFHHADEFNFSFNGFSRAWWD